MADTKPIPIRLTSDMIKRLDQAAVNAHLSNRTEVIKLCISSFLDYFEEHGSASLPLDWKEMLRDLDGRTRGELGGGNTTSPKPLVEKSIDEEREFLKGRTVDQNE